jgi:hypothetical protein
MRAQKKAATARMQHGGDISTATYPWRTRVGPRSKRAHSASRSRTLVTIPPPSAWPSLTLPTSIPSRRRPFPNRRRPSSLPADCWAWPGTPDGVGKEADSPYTGQGALAGRSPSITI